MLILRYMGSRRMHGMNADHCRICAHAVINHTHKYIFARQLHLGFVNDDSHENVQCPNSTAPMGNYCAPDSRECAGALDCATPKSQSAILLLQIEEITANLANNIPVLNSDAVHSIVCFETRIAPIGALNVGEEQETPKSLQKSQTDKWAEKVLRSELILKISTSSISAKKHRVGSTREMRQKCRIS